MFIPCRNDAKLSLSTATPSIGGSAPKLETAKLTLIPNAFPHRGRSSSFKKKARHSYGFGEESKTIEAPEAQVSEGLSSSVFEISTIATVPSDNSGHKVSSYNLRTEGFFHQILSCSHAFPAPHVYIYMLCKVLRQVYCYSQGFI